MSYVTSTPSVWFTQITPPVTIQDNAIYIWEESGFLQLGVSVRLPGSITPANVLVILNSEADGYPDAGLYTQIIKHVVTAYKTNTLELHRTTVANEVLPAIPVSTVTVSTAKNPAVFVRYQFSVTSNDYCEVSMVVTDMHGFVLARNATVVIEGFSTAPTIVTGNPDVTTLPISTSTLAQSGNFTGSTLLAVATADLSTYRPLPMLWYGTLGNSLPASVDVRHLAVWYDSANKLKFSLALPLDEVLTKPTSTFRRGAVNDFSGAICNGKWWFMLDLSTGIGAGRESAFLTKLLNAANNGVLFITNPIPVSLTASNPATYHAVSNSVTVNFGMRHGSRVANNIGTYYDQLVYITTMDDAGTILGQASARVRVECGGGVAIFPSDGLFLSSHGLNCATVSCGNPAQVERLVNHGPSTGISVLQGKGGLPTGTEMIMGIKSTIWDLVKFTVTNYNSYPTWYNAYALNISATTELAGPYMGLQRSIHSNHVARAAVLGYTHYFYPDVFHPLDMGKIPTFGAAVGGVNFTAWTRSQATVVADDDHVSAITESLKGKSVYLSPPSYTGISPTTQDVTKSVYIYLPDSDTQYATVPMTSDTALTMDLSFYRKPTPLLATNYGKPISEYQCRATLTDNTLTYEALSNVPCGANLFIGFTREANMFSYRISHTLTLPSPVTTNRVFTGVTNYPEFAVPFTCSNPADVGAGTLTPLAPAFTGKLPPNYSMLWVDWMSITPTTIMMYYWKGPEQYDVSTVYTSVPPGNVIVAVTLNVVVGTDTAMVFDGSVRLLMELKNSDVGNFSDVKLYAGDILVASSTGVLPWIQSGSFMIHAHGDSNIDEVIVGDILIESGVYTPITAPVGGGGGGSTPVTNVVHSDYVELQVETISVPITSSTYTALNLKPYTIYWETTQKMLYIPVMTRAVNVPTQLARCAAYSQQSATPAVITDLLGMSGPVTRVYMSSTHGLQYVPVGADYQVFTSQDTVTTDDVIVYHWRKGVAYGTSVGPLGATIVPGVTVPTRVATPSTGLTTNLMQALALSTSPLVYNVEAIDKNVLLTGVQNGTAYAKLPLVFSHGQVSKYTVQFTRASVGTWQVSQTLTSHLAVCIYPSRPDYVGVPEFPLLAKPQQKAVRILFPRGEGTVLVQTGFYRGYGWDSLNVSSYITEVAPFDQIETVSLSGLGQVSESNGGAIIALTITNINGQMGITLYENRVPKLTGTLPIPYINNGTLALTLQNAGNQASELLGNLLLLEGDQIDETGQQGNLIYCVPTATFDHSARLDANKEVTLTAIPGNYRYAFISYVVTNNGLSIGTVTAHSTLDEIGENTRIGNFELAPNTSKVVELVMVNRNEKIIFVSTVPNIDVLVTVTAQL